MDIKWNFVCLALVIMIITDFVMDKIFDIYEDEFIVIMEDEDETI